MLIYLCVLGGKGYAPATAGMWSSEGELVGVGSPFLACGSERSNSGSQAWQQSLLLNEPLPWPDI